MTFFLKIINEVKSRTLLRVNGNSGKLYGFKWDGKLRAYTYMPARQEEVDDLFRTMHRSTRYVFVPVAIKPVAVAQTETVATGADTITESVTITEAAETKKPLPAMLVEMALFRGVIVTEDDTIETVERLIVAYDKGAKDSLNSLPAVKKKPRRPTTAKPEKPE